MRTTHTPAPWLFDRYADGTAHFCDRGGSDILKANESIGDDERAANVRLVKAAPDLLDALRDCAAALATAKAFHKGRPPWVETDEAALVAAQAAIDKAIGGQTVETLPSYQVSARVVLRPGDRFRVSGGPYWRSTAGERIPLAVRGVCRLVAVYRERRRVWLLVRARDGMAVLHVEGRRRNRLMPELVCRPYKIRGKIRAIAKA